MLTGIDSGITDRAALVDYVKNYDGLGLARHYKWDATGELAAVADLDLQGSVAPSPFGPATGGPHRDLRSPPVRVLTSGMWADRHWA